MATKQIPIGEIVRKSNLSGLTQGKAIELLRQNEEFSKSIRDTVFNGTVVEGDLNDILSYIREYYDPEPENVSQLREQTNEFYDRLYSDALYKVKGARGRTLWVFEDRCVIKVDVTVGSVITGNITDGVKTIFYHDCIGIQYREPGTFIGYLQLETASGLMNNSSNNMFNENTFTFERNDTTILMREIYEYVCARVSLYKQL